MPNVYRRAVWVNSLSCLQKVHLLERETIATQAEKVRIYILRASDSCDQLMSGEAATVLMTAGVMLMKWHGYSSSSHLALVQRCSVAAEHFDW